MNCFIKLCELQQREPQPGEPQQKKIWRNETDNNNNINTVYHLSEMCSSRAWRSSAICYLYLVFVSQNRRLMWNHANAQHTTHTHTAQSARRIIFNFLVSLSLFLLSTLLELLESAQRTQTHIRIQVEHSCLPLFCAGSHFVRHRQQNTTIFTCIVTAYWTYSPRCDYYHHLQIHLFILSI